MMKVVSTYLQIVFTTSESVTRLDYLMNAVGSISPFNKKKVEYFSFEFVQSNTQLNNDENT